MKKAVIIYLSKKGTTKYFGKEIADFLKEKDIEAKATSIYDANPEIVIDADYVLLGAWTHGLMIVLQHPDKPWVEFAKQLPNLNGKKVGFFTTYTLATGSMFRKMEKPLKEKIDTVNLTLKSKNDKLTEDHKSALKKFLNS